MWQIEILFHRGLIMKKKITIILCKRRKTLVPKQGELIFLCLASPAVCSRKDTNLSLECHVAFKQLQHFSSVSAVPHGQHYTELEVTERMGSWEEKWASEGCKAQHCLVVLEPPRHLNPSCPEVQRWEPTCSESCRHISAQGLLWWETLDISVLGGGCPQGKKRLKHRQSAISLVKAWQTEIHKDLLQHLHLDAN